MTDIQDPTPPAADPAPTRRRKPLWTRVLKWGGIAIAALLLIIVLLISAGIWVLTPERLTPLATDYATEYLNATVKAKRVELTFWHTFPRVQLEVEGLEITSHSLSQLMPAQRAMLPSDADSLLRVNMLRGGVNLSSLALGTLSLYDLEIDAPRVNLVAYNDSITNYDIVPPSEEKEIDEGFSMPIEFDRFRITDDLDVKYFSLADSIDASVRLTQTDLTGEDAPVYQLIIDGLAAARLADIDISSLRLGLDGKVRWDQKEPERVAFEEFDVKVNDVALRLDAAIQLADTLGIESFKLQARDVAFNSLVDLIPPTLRGEIGNVSSNATIDLGVTLSEPYKLSDGTLPSMDVSLAIPEGNLYYDRLRLENVAADIFATIDGHDLDRSVIRINNFALAGRAIDFNLQGTVNNPISDPLMKLTFRGNVNFGNIPTRLADRLPMTLKGNLKGNFKANSRVSYFDPKEFHRILLDGDIHLTDFMMQMRDSTLTASTSHADLKFGTSSTVNFRGHKVDSLLTAQLNIDTVSVLSQGMTVTGRGLSAKVGARNVATSLDTTRINPLGANIMADLLMLRSDSDSSRIRLRESSVSALIMRYKHDAKAPLLRLGVKSKSAIYADPVTFASIRGLDSRFVMHPRAKRQPSAAMQARIDSIKAANPGLSTDSISALLRARMRSRAARQKVDTTALLDFEIDNSVRSLLRRWQASGAIKATHARLFTPYMPLRNRLTDVDITFSTDSVTIRDLKAQIGHSDFLINGRIANISRALTSRRGSPIEVNLALKSDTIDINEIAQASIAGAAFAERVAGGQKVSIDQSGSDEQIQASVNAEADTSTLVAFVVPSNVKASLDISARRVLYADIWFDRFIGNVSIANNAVNLSRLSGFTPMGSMNLTALYRAPSKEDVSFAAGMVVRRLDLHEFLHMIPQIDSIMPLLRDVSGIIDTEIAFTTELDSLLDFKFHTLDMMMNLSGDSLVLLDSKTFRTISKWLLFKHKDRNMIDHMNVEMMIRDSHLDLFPFVFDIDRYKIGVQGGNDGALNLDYHIAVLKSPLPFKFGINITGRPDHYKIRLGRAHFNEHEVASSRQLTDTVRINLIREIDQMFKFGIRSGKDKRLINTQPPVTAREYNVSDALTHADSLMFIQQGVIQAPPGFFAADSIAAAQSDKESKHKRKRKR